MEFLLLSPSEVTFVVAVMILIILLTLTIILFNNFYKGVKVPKTKFDTYKVTLTFNAVVNVAKVNGKTSVEALNKLIREETEWIGEPVSANGCVVTMQLKDIGVN